MLTYDVCMFKLKDVLIYFSTAFDFKNILKSTCTSTLEIPASNCVGLKIRIQFLGGYHKRVHHLLESHISSLGVMENSIDIIDWLLHLGLLLNEDRTDHRGQNRKV